MLGTISVAVMLPTKIEISLGPDLAATLQGSGSSGLAPDSSPPSESASDLADFHRGQGLARRFAGRGREIAPGLSRGWDDTKVVQPDGCGQARRVEGWILPRPIRHRPSAISLSFSRETWSLTVSALKIGEKLVFVRASR